MTVSRKVLCLAVLVGGWSILSPTFAEAKNARPNAKNQKLHAMVSARQVTTDRSPDLGFGTLPLPLLRSQVNRFLRNLNLNRNVPISASLAANPNSFQANARRAFALEVFRERALLKPSHVAGGVFFSPPNSTPYFPVTANNFLARLPIFRVIGFLGFT